MRRHLLLFAFNIMFCFVYSQDKTDDIINYSSEKKLAWSDFKAKPREDQAYDAMTEWGMHFSYSYDGNYFVFTLICQFQKSDSWVKEEKMTDELLEHEQLHFDIAEIYTRKMRKILLKTDYHVKTVYKVVNDIHEDHYLECNRVQRLYDKETMFSTNRGKQAEWEKEIAKQLKSLAKYSDEKYSFESKDTK